MKILTWLRQRWICITICALLALVLVPYAFSRAASPWRSISVQATSDAFDVQPRVSEKTLRVVCYNIAHGRGLAESNWDGGSAQDRIARLDQIADLLREINADIVVLNEVDFAASWSNSVNQAEYIARRAGYPEHIEQRNLDFRVLTWQWRFGNAVLSKLPIHRADVLDLPGYSTWETLLAGKKRGIRCEIEVDSQVIQLIAAHFSHRSEDLRVRSAQEVLDTMEAYDLPTIVAGDLNSTPPGYPKSFKDSSGRNAIALIDQSEQFRRLPADPDPAQRDLTFRSDDPHCVIDWILIPRTWQFQDYHVVPSPLSDHRPVYADVHPRSMD